MTFTPDTPQEEIAAARAAALRALADQIESNPALAGDYYDKFEINLYPVPDALTEVVSAMGGRREKQYRDRIMSVTRDFGGNVSVSAHVNRAEVCEAVVVGHETVEVPDPAAPKVLVERPIVEWKCSPVLDEAVAS